MILLVTPKRPLDLKISQCLSLTPNGTPCNWFYRLLHGMINSEHLLFFTSLTLSSSVQTVFPYVHSNLNLCVGISTGYKFHMVIPNEHEYRRATMCQCQCVSQIWFILDLCTATWNLDKSMKNYLPKTVELSVSFCDSQQNKF